LARKILLADDSVTAQNMGRKILADAGYEVIAVNNGSAALKKIAETKPDLVILDVYMPGYSGLEVCQRMKESPETSRIPVLLTVGKLEPFKPEEAQRVRAEGYIVKPFEASELLSALSKLEDKVVPRAEPSRPGRFARAFAAVEDSGFGGRRRAGEDNSWKNRIGFPHEKTEAEQKSAADSGDQSDGYNPLNRDLRTVVETPAELAEEKLAQIKQEETRHALRHENDDSRREELKFEEVSREKAPGDGYERRVIESSAETSVDVSSLSASGVSPAALPTDVTDEELAAITAAAAQMQIASAGIEGEHRAADQRSRSTDSESAAGSEADAGPTQSEETNRDLPVTIAAGAESVAGSSSGAPRWTAVAVALEGNEASVSLDQEMQKAGASAPVPIIEVQQTVPSMDSSSQPRGFASEALAIEPATLPVEPTQPEPVAQADLAAPSEPTTVADAETHIAQPEPDSMPSSSAAAEPASVAQPAWQPGPQEASTISSAASMASDAQDSMAAEFRASSPGFETPEANSREISNSAEVSADSSDHSQGFRRFERPEASDAAPPANSYTYSSEPVPQESIAQAQPNSHLQEAEPSEAPQPAAHSESVKTTAAAWASWRQIRDNSTPTESPSRESETTGFAKPGSAAAEAHVTETAAAVAAGAEQILQTVAGADPTSENSKNSSDVASIVDSVLADLRPKLMEEISRKMASKK
jgi:CheY-like chemotaxis protein